MGGSSTPSARRGAALTGPELVRCNVLTMELRGAVDAESADVDPTAVDVLAPIIMEWALSERESDPLLGCESAAAKASRTAGDDRLCGFCNGGSCWSSCGVGGEECTGELLERPPLERRTICPAASWTYSKETSSMMIDSSEESEWWGK